jgi:LAO/AO transport system kinase
VTDELVERLLSGDRRALARVLTLIEQDSEDGRRALAALYPHTGRAHIVGITGGGGSGKSTLTAALTLELRKRGRSVGIVAVDPSSPFTRGALLGDRIRMQQLSGDAEVFVRSMATRGQLGGLAAMTGEAVAAMDAAGRDIVLIETVGAGQDEVEVASQADTTVLVLTPAGGDDVQAMKAGVMEIADIFVVNKADVAGADKLAAQLIAMVTMAARGRLDAPVLRTVATKREGIAELADAIDEHKRKLVASGELEELRRERARAQVLALTRRELLKRALATGDQQEALDELAGAVARREIDPYQAARRLIDTGSAST